MKGILPLMRRQADVGCGDATLRKHPSSGQAAHNLCFATPGTLPAIQGQRWED